ncbi:MAG TPA: hypothetical protein DCX78_10725, partial [Nitrospina sp.]|nr:hypothetical protein [Nitrospina sp.]
MKQLAIFSLFCGLFALVACDKELKEHPISPQVQQEMAAREKASDPTRSISGTIEFEESIASKIPENGTLFLIARP